MQKTSWKGSLLEEIQRRNVSPRWGSTVGVDGFNLTIPDREFSVLREPSGCGTTTTMRMITELEAPTEGEVVIDGRTVNEFEPKHRDVARVLKSYALHPDMTAFDSMRFPLKVRCVDPSTHEDEERQASTMFELEEFLHRKPAEFADGQRQRVAPACAIVRESNMFPLDEPLSNLDERLRVSTRTQIKNLNHELKVATVFVTHDQIATMKLADRVVVIDKGAVKQVGTPSNSYDSLANAFFAGIIGNPAMNLMKGRMEEGAFVAGIVCIEGSSAADGPAKLGSRAEDAGLSDAGHHEIEALIYKLELLGAAKMVTIRIGGDLVALRAPKDFRSEIGDTVSLSVPREICHLFDDAGERMEV